jgi:putative lipase involved disintegration of autophagic bodies
MTDYLNKLFDEFQNSKVFITGHSLGGSMATLMAFEIFR